MTTQGATANDSSDDTDEILAAFADAASQGKGVSFPAGTFRVFCLRLLALRDDPRGRDVSRGQADR